MVKFQIKKHKNKKKATKKALKKTMAFGGRKKNALLKKEGKSLKKKEMRACPRFSDSNFWRPLFVFTFYLATIVRSS